MLSDDSEAFTSYDLSIELQSSNIDELQQFSNIKISESTSAKIPLDIGDANLTATFCNTQETVNWVWYSKSQKLLLHFYVV